MKRYLGLFVICIFAYLFIKAAPAVAQTMENGLYRVQVKNLNSVSDELKVSEYNLNDTSDQITSKPTESKNFKIKTGFDNYPHSSLFSFSISNMIIDFGTLSPTNPITRAITLTVNSANTQGFNITSTQNHELVNTSTKATIPDTSCDDGKCSENISSKWINTLTYGFGYRCERENSTCVANDSSFVPENYFKQFPNASKDEPTSFILSGGAENNLEATILYKVNISSSQPVRAYSNEITFLATPNY